MGYSETAASASSAGASSRYGVAAPRSRHALPASSATAGSATATLEVPALLLQIARDLVRGRGQVLLGDRVVVLLLRDRLDESLVQRGAEDVLHLRLVRLPRLLHRVVHRVRDRGQPAVLLNRHRVVERRPRHGGAANGAGELLLHLARREPLEELHRALRVLRTGRDPADERADRRAAALLLRRRRGVDLPDHLRRRRVVDLVDETRVLRQRGALALEENLSLLVGVELGDTGGHVRDEAEEALERSDALGAGEAWRPVRIDEVGAVGAHERQVRLDDRVALHASRRPPVELRRVRLRLRDLVDVVPGLRRL